ncbi:hypothetical protein ACIP93_22240 [Streptomyces sp. NPDC088745]|uniref:hypothetical protein n=1 Tax=Streptomyces sp. NPDC088745 TaxID=3365884 RepID=UPI0038199B0D
MRLRDALVLTVAAATLAAAPGAIGSAAALPPRPHPQEAAAPRLLAAGARPTATPVCGDPGSAGFPLTTRIHRAPAAYRAGGDSAAWDLDLANTTDRPCAGVHPVLVLVDEARTLRPEHIAAAFHADGAWHRVPFVRTDHDELIGVFAEDLPGFAVGPGGTHTVRVRLGFAEGARATGVVANAAIVQRDGDDGDWVGQSDDYRFAVTDSPEPEPEPEQEQEQESGDAADADSVRRLAQSGPGPLLGLGGTAVALLLGGGALVAGSRRTRAPARR